MLTKTVTIINKLGLHARAAAKFVSLASKYDCEIELKRDKRTVNGKSIMGVMLLAAAKGTDLELVTHGNQEAEAMDALCNLIENKFDESE